MEKYIRKYLLIENNNVEVEYYDVIGEHGGYSVKSIKKG